MALSRDGLDREKPFTDLEEEAYVGKIVTVEYVDDFDGQSIEADVVDTVDFSFRGKDYSLVLTAKNGAQFDKDMAPYIRAAKKAQARDARGSRGKAGPEPRQAGKRKAVPGRAVKAKAVPRRKAAPRKATAAKSDPGRNRAIREWAVANGHTVSQRGRLPAAIEDAYNAAH